MIAGDTVKILGVLDVLYTFISYFKGMAFLIFPAWAPYLVLFFVFSRVGLVVLVVFIRVRKGRFSCTILALCFIS